MRNLRSFSVILFALLATLCIAATGCVGAAAQLRRVTADRDALTQDFKALLQTNGVLAKVNEEFDCDNYVVKSVNAVKDGNGLVHVVIERPAYDDPQRSGWYRTLWFLFDRQGHLLSWSAEVSGSWQVCDVTGDSKPDLLVTDNGHAGDPDEERARSYYHLFQLGAEGDQGLFFAKGPVNGTVYPIQVFTVAGSRLPFVVTVDPGLPATDESEMYSGWRTVVRCFKDGRPRVVLVLRGNDLDVHVYDGHFTITNKSYEDADHLFVSYDPSLREFQLDAWTPKDKDAKSPILYSAKVPE